MSEIKAIIKKITQTFEGVKERFAKKTIRQKIRFCLAMTFLLTFLFFVIKGNFFDPKYTQKTESAQSSSFDGNASEEEQTAQQTQNQSHRFYISRVDIGIMAALCAAYGIHKYREKKREKRF